MKKLANIILFNSKKCDYCTMIDSSGFFLQTLGKNLAKLFGTGSQIYGEISSHNIRRGFAEWCTELFAEWCTECSTGCCALHRCHFLEEELSKLLRRLKKKKKNFLLTKNCPIKTFPRNLLSFSLTEKYTCNIYVYVCIHKLYVLHIYRYILYK